MRTFGAIDSEKGWNGMVESQIQNDPIVESSSWLWSDRMRYVVNAVLICLPLTGSAVFTQCVQSTDRLSISASRPALAFETHLIYAPESRTGDQSVLSYSFRFQNRGSDTVRISKVTPSCACLASAVSLKEVLPEEFGELTAQVRTASESPGLHEYMVTVAYTDPKPRTATVYLKVVLPEKKVLIEPRALYLMGKSAGGHSHQVTISDFRSVPLTLQKVTSSSHLFTPSIASQTLSSDGMQGVIEVGVSAELPAGQQRGVVQVETNDPLFPVLEVPVAVLAEERLPEDAALIQVRPELVSMNVTMEQVSSEDLRVSIPRKWKLGQIHTFPEELTVAFEEESSEEVNATILRMDLGFSKLPDAPLQHGLVTLTANDGAEMISVPIRLIWPRAESSLRP
jgi:hypothetical protein